MVCISFFTVSKQASSGPFGVNPRVAMGKMVGGVGRTRNSDVNSVGKQHYLEDVHRSDAGGTIDNIYCLFTIHNPIDLIVVPGGAIP